MCVVVLLHLGVPALKSHLQWVACRHRTAEDRHFVVCLRCGGVASVVVVVLIVHQMFHHLLLHQSSS
jgi:hypothetical protein